MSNWKKLKQIGRWAILLIGIGMLSLYFVANQTGKTVDLAAQKASLRVSEHEFEVEIAKTPQQRSQGLSGRDFLCQRCAMLFIFEKKDTYGFWMKDMKFNLDMLWLDGNTIVQIDRNVSFEKGLQEKRSARVPVDRVLEINAGQSEQFGIKEGDRIKF